MPTKYHAKGEANMRTIRLSTSNTGAQPPGLKRRSSGVRSAKTFKASKQGAVVRAKKTP